MPAESPIARHWRGRLRNVCAKITGPGGFPIFGVGVVGDADLRTRSVALDAVGDGVAFINQVPQERLRFADAAAIVVDELAVHPLGELAVLRLVIVVAIDDAGVDLACAGQRSAQGCDERFSPFIEFLLPFWWGAVAHDER